MSIDTKKYFPIEDVYDGSNTYAAKGNVYKCTIKNIKEVINQIISQKPNEKVLIELPNTIGLTDDIINLLTDNMEVQIIGGYNEAYGTSFQFDVFDVMKAKAVYSKKELLAINSEIKIIEAGIDPKWNEYEKALYLYEYLKYNTAYRDPNKSGVDGNNHERSRTWDSLIGLTTHLSTCAGYSFMYQELCTRQNIECQCLGNKGHAWNVIKINNQNFFVDIVQDSQEYEARKDQTFGFGFDRQKMKKRYEHYDHKPWGVLNKIDETVKTIDPKWVESAKKKVTANIPKKQNAQKRVEDFKKTREIERELMMKKRLEVLGKFKYEGRPMSL